MNIHNSKMLGGHLRWAVILFAFGIITFDYIDRGIVSTALPILTSEFNLNPYFQALVGDGFTYGYLIMNPVVGYFLDRFGAKKVFAYSGTGWGIVQLTAAGAFSGIYLVINRILLGIGEAVGFPGITKITAEWMTKSEKARSGTIGDSGVNAGVVLGTLLLLALTYVVNNNLAWRLAFIISGGLTIFLILLLAYFLYDSPEKDPRISREELNYIIKNRDDIKEQKKLPVRSWLVTRDYWGTMMGLGAQAGIFFGLLTWLPLYLFYARHQSLNLTLGYTALVWGMGFIGEIIGGFIVDYLNRSYGPNRGMKVGFSVSSLGVTFGILATIYATSAFEAVLILAITFFLLRWSGIQWAVSSFIVPRAYAGQWGGHIGFWETLWGIIIPLVFGATVAVTKAYTEGMFIFVFIGIIYFLGAVVVTRYKKLKSYNVD